jgi:hypothetical protein
VKMKESAQGLLLIYIIKKAPLKGAFKISLHPEEE